MRTKLVAIGDDSWIEDEHGAEVFKVNGKAMRIRHTFLLEDASGREVAKIQERKLHIRDTMVIEREGDTIATVRKRVIGLRDHLMVDLADGAELKVHGNLVDHEYEIEGHQGTVAEVSRRWFRVRDTYGVEIAPNQDDAMILAVTVAVEDMTRHD